MKKIMSKVGKGFDLNFLFGMIVCLVVAWSVPSVHGYYFGSPVCPVESSVANYDQRQPDILFDTSDSLHVVWMDERDGVDHIYYRMGSGGVFLSSSIRADNAADCNMNNCELARPKLGMISLGYTPFLDVVYNSVLGHRLRLSEYDFTNWEEKLSVDETATSNITDYAVAAVNDYLYVAYKDEANGGIMLKRYLGNNTWDSDNYLISESVGETFSNVDIAADEEGYIYIVFNHEDSNTPSSNQVLACRTMDPSSLYYGVTQFREVDDFTQENPNGDPAICVIGSYNNADLLVGITFMDYNSDEIQVRAVFEPNEDWENGSEIMWMSPNAIYHDVGVNMNDSVAHPDIDIAGDRRACVVWDAAPDASVRKVYGNVSYSPLLADSFMGAQVVGPATSEFRTENPTVKFSPLNEIAVAYFQHSMYDDTVMVNWSVVEFSDGADSGSFEGWDTHSGVSVEHDPPGRPGNPAYKFDSASRGSLVRDYGIVQMAGIIEFWFYDSGTTVVGEDFWVRVDGNTQKKEAGNVDAGVYRMLGIRNSLRSDKYSIKVDGNDWQELSIARTIGWHHVSIEVCEDGILMYLDPESNPEPVNSLTLDPHRDEFQSFNKITFQGGSPSDPYYLDDININANPVVRDVPSLNFSGIVILMLLLTAIFLARKN